MNKVNVGNINIIDDTKDEEINSIGNSNIERINIKTNLGRNSQNKIKSRNENASQKKNKYVKRDINKLTNLYDINQDNTQKVNYYLNEINQKKLLMLTVLKTIKTQQIQNIEKITIILILKE